MKCTHSRIGRSATALLAGLCLGLACTVAETAESLGRAPLAADAGQVEVFVRLSTPAVSELNAQSIEATGTMASSDAQRRQAALVSAQQASFRAQLAGLQAQELSSLRVGANGIRMRVPASAIESLRALPGVVSVGRVMIHKIDNIDSVPWIGALRAAQNFGLTGKGIKIGIIDTGIDYLHANFRKDGSVGDYDGNDKNVIEPGTFPTAKVVGGWDFAGPTYDANVAGSVPQPDPDPLDGNGHGSHVAGTTAGFGVTGTIGQGVAPDAELYALKVFNDTAGSTDVTSDAIEWAMDPNGDGDMSDHLDVINMSLGSPFGEPADPSAISSNNAVKVGIVVVASAGNEGNVPYVTGAPAVAPRAISVAATTPGGRLFSRVTVNDPAAVAGVKNSLEGAGPVLFKDTGPISSNLVIGTPVNGCFPDPANPTLFLHTPLTNAAEVAGKIVLIRRGVCGFIDKYLVAQASGARAILVYNDGANATRVDPLVMGGLTNEVTIPGAMISSTDGFAIAALATATAASPVTVTMDAARNPALEDQVAGFSSRGPASGGDTGFKPDLAAPGVLIVSTGVGTGTGSELLSGTSMAAPHVSGAAALLVQEHPNLRPGAIKALLQNSTVNGNASSDTSLSRLGTGVIRVDQAAALTSYASPGGVSFGRINPVTPVVVLRDVKLTNMSRSSRRFNVTHVAHTAYPGLSVTCPSSVTVGPRSDRSFTIRLRLDPAASNAGGAFDNGSITQTEADGWCVLSDGKDSLRVGYLAVVDAAAKVQVTTSRNWHGIDVRNRGPAFGIAEGFTLAPRDREWSNGRHDSCDKDRWGRRDRGWDNDSSDDADSYGRQNGHDDGSAGGDDDVDSCLIARLGVRRADPDFFFGLSVVEFGVALNKSFEHVSNLDIDLFLDTDNDGVEDTELEARDLRDFVNDPNQAFGQYVTAQFLPDGSAFLDWLATGWDFNDRVLILPFTDKASGGGVPASFKYRLVVTNRQGEVDTQTGTIDLAKEVKPDLNSFGIEAQTPPVHINVTGTGRMLWFFPNNTRHRQDDSVWAQP